MTSNKEIYDMQHGGNLAQIAEFFPQAPQPYIDLSTGINPYPYHLPAAKPECHSRLPEEAEMLAAREGAVKYYDTTPENTHLGAGMQPLLFAIAALRFRQFGTQKTRIYSPTYSEYEKIFAAAGHDVSPATNHESRITIICNPNNPDARIIPKAELLQLADELAKKNGLLIVDEAFGDFYPETSVASEVATRENLIVLKSVGKFFGLAGLRVSAALAPEKWGKDLQNIIGSWPIATASCLQLPAMFADENWQEETRKKLTQESEIWRQSLAKKFNIIGHTPLFTLVECKSAEIWHRKFAENGILVRKFSYNPKWLRFGLPHKKDLERVCKILS